MSKKKKNKINMNKLISDLIIFIILIVIATIINSTTLKDTENTVDINTSANTTYSSIEDIPDYKGEIYITINNNKPYFNEENYRAESFEKYSELDYLGRCGVAYANVCKETMPPKGDERGDISSVFPTGWKQAKYNGEYLYNRCHLIAYMLSDEDANEQNLITGTRYFNVQGMLPFEKQVADYINENENNHVLYRVTPIFKGNNLLASGVEMEAFSVEDNGEGVCFNVFVYNIQPGVSIDYATGKLLE
ncbi:MAG: DNA/RNA non-specific endonuclease [Candidatus Scatovivens sp.]